MAMTGPDQTQGQFWMGIRNIVNRGPAVHDRPLLVPPPARQAAVPFLRLDLPDGLSRDALRQRLAVTAGTEPAYLEPAVRLAVVMMLSCDAKRADQPGRQPQRRRDLPAARPDGLLVDVQQHGVAVTERVTDS